MHPLIRSFMTHPDLLLEHLGAYGELAGAELETLAKHYRRNWLLLGMSMLLGAITLGFFGTAFMLWVVSGHALGMSQLWLLGLPGALSLLGLLACLMGIYASQPLEPLAVIGEQLKADVHWLREQADSQP